MKIIEKDKTRDTGIIQNLQIIADLEKDWHFILNGVIDYF